MVTFFDGRPLAVPAASISFTISMPSTTLPKTTCLPSSHDVTTVVMKNYRNTGWLNGGARERATGVRTCEPLVLGPAFAMESRPGLLWVSLKFSSAREGRM